MDRLPVLLEAVVTTGAVVAGGRVVTGGVGAGAAVVTAGQGTNTKTR